MENIVRWTIGETGCENGFAWGELSLSLEGAESAGHCFYTDIIDTGFGPGVFDLRFAAADKCGYDGGILTKDRLLFGDMETFSQSAYVPGIPKVSLGAYASPQDGTFRLALMLKEPAIKCVISLRWWAEKPLHATEHPAIAQENVQIVSESVAKVNEAVQKATAGLEPENEEFVSEEDGPEEMFYICNAPRKLHRGESYTFRCVLPSGIMRPIWKVLSPEGGSITEDGVYTAPQEQGIYQVAARIPETDREVSLYIMVN